MMMVLDNAKHRVTLESLATVLTYTRPCVQRSIDEEHVRRMVQDQRDEAARTGCFSMLQSITIAVLGDRAYVLDGQHRILAFDALSRDDTDKRLPLNRVVLPVVQYRVDTLAELTAYYTRINQHKPVHPLELRDSWQSFERPFVEWLVAAFPSAYFKRGAVTRSPHIGLEQLKTELENRNRDAEMTRVCENDPQRLCAVVSSFNARIHELFVASNAASNDAASSSIAPDVRKKLTDCRAKVTSSSTASTIVSTQGPCRCCYLGAFRKFEWLDVCVYCLRNGRSDVGEDTCRALLLNSRTGTGSNSKATKALGARIPKHVRRLVWSKTNPENSIRGGCYTCGRPLAFEDMECGHVVARALGGSTDVSNLMPVCRTCNGDMGIQHMEAYRRRICEMRGDAYYYSADEDDNDARPVAMEEE